MSASLLVGSFLVTSAATFFTQLLLQLCCLPLSLQRDLHYWPKSRKKSILFLTCQRNVYIIIQLAELLYYIVLFDSFRFQIWCI